MLSLSMRIRARRRSFSVRLKKVLPEDRPLFAVSSGMLTVNGDGSVQVIAEEACKVDELDAAVC